MIKLILSDLDGVLLSSKQLHFEALNKALETIDQKYVISQEDHIKYFDGLSTKKKLEILTEKKKLPKELHAQISKLKQDLTISCIDKYISYNQKLVDLFIELKKDYKIAVCSNAVKNSVRLMLEKIGVIDHIDRYFANEDVEFNKPHPQIYMKAMVEFGCTPDETLIIEDSAIGRQAALTSGAHIFGVDSPKDLETQDIFEEINSIKDKKQIWKDNRTNVIIPMCGSCQDFVNKYGCPKFMVDINGKPMIQRVVESLAIEAKYIFVVNDFDYEKYKLEYLLNLIAPNCEIVINYAPTEGIVSTILKARNLIDNDEHLIIAHEDQLVEYNSSNFCYSNIAEDYDAGILCFDSDNNKFSYSKTNDNGFVEEVMEKQVISSNANTGIYFFKHGKDFVKYGDQLIEKNHRINGLFYDSMVLNEMCDDKKIKMFKCDKFVSLGYVDWVEKYLGENSN